MTVKLSTLKHIRYLVEQNASFGVNQSGSLAYNTMRHLADSTIALEQEMLNNDIQQQIIDGMAPSIVGRKRCSVSIKSYLYGAPTPLSGNATPASFELADFFGVVMGGHTAQSGSTQSGAGSSSGSFTPASPGCFPNGTIVGMLNSSGKLEARKILGGTTTKTVHTVFSFVPSSGQTIYNSHTCYLAENCSGTLQFYTKGHTSDDVWVAVGCNGGFSLENVLGQIPKVSFDLKGASWFTGSAGSILPKETYVSASHSAVPVFRDSKVFFYPTATSTTTGVEVKAKTLTIKPAISYADVETPGGVENISEKVRIRNAGGVLTIELQTYYEDRSFYSAWAAGTEYGMLIQIGSAPGRTVVLSAPRVQIVNVVRNDIGGLTGQTLTLKCLDDNLTTATSGFSELAQSVFTLSFL